jgi:hypothetical protein
MSPGRSWVIRRQTREEVCLWKLPYLLDFKRIIYSKNKNTFYKRE